MILRPGTGNFTVNNKPSTSTSSTKPTACREAAASSFRTSNKFDLLVRVEGGGMHGQAGAVQHGVARALVEFSAELRGVFEEGRISHARSAHERTKEVRAAGSAKTLPVLETLRLVVASGDRLPAGDF